MRSVAAGDIATFARADECALKGIHERSFGSPLTAIDVSGMKVGEWAISRGVRPVGVAFSQVCTSGESDRSSRRKVTGQNGAT